MKHKISYFNIFTLLVIASGFAVASCSDNRADETISPIAVRITQPVRMGMQNRVSYMGTVHASREVKVIAQVQGTVVSLPKPEGAPVSKDEQVAKIYVPDITATSERLQADLDYWQRRYEADQRLVEAEALPSEQMEASLRAYLSAKAALAEINARLDKANEFSSIKGKVLSWLVEPGQHVMPGQPILLLGNDELEIHVEVVEEGLRRGIGVGIPVFVQDWHGHKFQSKVSDVAPVASGPARTFTVKLPVSAPENHLEDLRVGTSRQVDFILASNSNSIAVPLEAISNQGRNPRIFLIQENRAKKQTVTTGIEQDGLIEVTFPWNGEDWVAVSNLGNLEDGVSVFPVEVRTN